MKRAFDAGKVKHLPWILLSGAQVKGNTITDGKTTFEFPVVIKNFFGSRGNGNHKVDTPEEYKKVIAGKTANQYLIEPFFSGTVEFRVHMTAYGEIYCLRKMLKVDTPKEERWYRNDKNCVWITQFTQNQTNGVWRSFTNTPNPEFDQPSNWNEIIAECKKALLAVGGDILAVDVKAQSNKGPKGSRREKVDFFILEVNSAPSMGAITTEIYRKELPKILEFKYDNFRTKR